MSGLWSCTYSYDGYSATVPFTAAVTENGGEIFGTTLEPTTFGPRHVSEIEAEIEGRRRGQQVEFTKRYDPASGVVQPPLLYSGEANPDFTEVRGRWRFAGLLNRLRRHPTGTFIMTRVLGARASVSEQAETLVSA